MNMMECVSHTILFLFVFSLDRWADQNNGRPRTTTTTTTPSESVNNKNRFGCLELELLSRCSEELWWICNCSVDTKLRDCRWSQDFFSILHLVFFFSFPYDKVSHWHFCVVVARKFSIPGSLTTVHKEQSTFKGCGGL